MDGTLDQIWKRREEAERKIVSRACFWRKYAHGMVSEGSPSRFTEVA